MTDDLVMARLCHRRIHNALKTMITLNHTFTVELDFERVEDAIVFQTTFMAFLKRHETDVELGLQDHLTVGIVPRAKEDLMLKVIKAIINENLNDAQRKEFFKRFDLNQARYEAYAEGYRDGKAFASEASLDAMTDEQRFEILSRYCSGCGSKDKSCICMRDD